MLGLDSGDPLDAPFEGGLDVIPPPSEAGGDAPVIVDEGGADGGCGAGKKACNGCQSVDDPTFGCTATGCGSCATALGNPPQVTGYACPGCTISQCATDYVNCDKDASNGCEANLKGDNGHCGSCTKVCIQGDFCVDGGCTNNCPNTVCDASCVDLQTNPYNCNQCGKACGTSPNGNGNPKCSGGLCDYTCNLPYMRCSVPGCYDTANDPTHCGGGCQNCTTSAPPNGYSTGCANSQCQFACNSGYFYNGSVCVAFDSGTDAGQDAGKDSGADCAPPGSFCSPAGSNPFCCSIMCVPEGGGGHCN